jgi:hypothetical protein
LRRTGISADFTTAEIDKRVYDQRDASRNVKAGHHRAHWVQASARSATAPRLVAPYAVFTHRSPRPPMVSFKDRDITSE